jgi:cell wall-associated NlpC family hydrolase
MNFRNHLCGVIVCVLAIGLFSTAANAQEERNRIVPTTQTNPTVQRTNPPQVIKPTSSRPTTPPPTVNRRVLTNEIIVRSAPAQESLVKKTGSTNPTSPTENKSISKFAAYSAVSQAMMMNSIKSLLGLPYRYGSTGPNSYDCSGFVWEVFRNAGFEFERSSARNYWNQFEPVEGEDRFKFGTLVFFNRLGHVGIVVDEKGFYHASSSKGITYSKFEGYWSKRIVGFRRVPQSYLKQIDLQTAK